MRRPRTSWSRRSSPSTYIPSTYITSAYIWATHACRALFPRLTLPPPAQTFMVYEEDMPDSKTMLAANTVATTTLPHVSVFDAEQYETLSTQVTPPQK